MEPPPRSTIGSSLRWHRQQQHLSQEELAHLAGVSVRTVRNLESERISSPRASSVRMLAAALGVDDLEASRPYAVPSLLPLDVQGFTARGEQVSWLHEQLVPSTTADGPTPFAVLTGSPGVGKTALAVHWAHHASRQFPDGQLYVDLQGYAPELPVAPNEALHQFLVALGVRGPDLPATVVDRAALYRSLLAGRRMLVILDNARSSEQVRPLLPGSDRCAVLVTSRDRLAGLVARDGARRLDVQPLAEPDSVRLLATLGGSAAEHDHAALIGIARRCVHLPLALRIVAEHLAGSGLPAVAVVAALEDRLTLLDADDDARTAVRQVFSWSLSELPPSAVLAFQLVGVHPGRDLDEADMAALMGVGLEEAGRSAGRLVRAHLLTRDADGRLAAHDLLRAYARESAGQALAPQELTCAFDRLVDHLRWQVWHAVGRLPSGSGARPDWIVPDGTQPETVRTFADAHDASQWLDAERPALTWAVARTASTRPEVTIQLGAWLWPYLVSGGHQTDALAIQTYARDAARLVGDRTAEGEALGRLGILHKRAGDYALAIEATTEAIAAYASVGARVHEGRGRSDLGVHYQRMGRHDDAVASYREALAIFEDAGRADYVAVVLDNLGTLHEHRGDYAQARMYHAKALPTFERLGHRNRAARCRSNLGQAWLRLGDHAQAARCLQVAQSEFEELGDREAAAVNLDLLAELAFQTGRPELAVELGGRAVELARRVGNRQAEAEALDHLAAACRAVGDLEASIEHLRTALVLADRLGNARLRASVLRGLEASLSPANGETTNTSRSSATVKPS